MSSATPPLNGFHFAELQAVSSLQQFDQQFLQRLHSHDADLYTRLLAYRDTTTLLNQGDISALLLACAPILETFLGDLFDIQAELAAARAQIEAQHPVFQFKKWFVLRRARRRLTRTGDFDETFNELDAWLNAQLAGDIVDREYAVALLATHYLTDKDAYAEQIEQLTRWCLRAMTTPEGQTAVQDWVSFRLPAQINPQKLVPIRPIADDAHHFQSTQTHHRDGFKLTDPRMQQREVLSEIDYCLYCHDHQGDFCSKGFPVKKGESNLKSDVFGNVLTGCPLAEKISEMQVLKRDAYNIAALAMVMVDNPMCPATGHRICNDCMKACVYQKQTPVNVPQIETRVLSDVLALPWGVEIYDLLTRWNPLRREQYLPKFYNGLNVLIAGQGPAGFTLAHHLLMAGFAVVGIDGLKLEPLPERLLTQPVRDYHDLEEALDTRVMAGFGGVAEYGITVRWDKNFLKLIYLSLSRRPFYQVYGSIRFGGTITVDDAWALGFDHVAIAVGAGLPQALPIPNSLAPGMRQATDFLMTLQLTGAAKVSSLANLQVRLPAVVIGGGLTGIDTATEIQAYYLVQIEKILQRYQQLSAAWGEARVREQLDEQSLEVLQEMLDHAHAVQVERQRAAAAGEQPQLQSLLQQWGGVTVAYRRSLQESPAYTCNHEEVTHAFAEGIFYREGLEPVSVSLDRFGHVQALVCVQRQRNADGQWQTTDTQITLPARAILVATGAKPNVAYEFEHRGTFAKSSTFQYQPHQEVDGTLQPVDSVGHCKQSDFGAFTSYQQYDHRVSFIGDTHPVFHGSVVKAIASGMRSYPAIVAAFGDHAHIQGDVTAYHRFKTHLQDCLQATVVNVRRYTPSMVELQIRAPQAAQKFRPGQFFRVQNYEHDASIVHGTRLHTEALALLGSKVDKEHGVISLLVLEHGASARLCATFKSGQAIACMGPTGVRASIPTGGETVMVIGGRLGAANMRALGPALRAAGNRVLFIACLQMADDVFCQAELEAAADAIVWVTEIGEPVATQRQQDCSATGAFIDVLQRYAAGEYHAGIPSIRLESVNRIMLIGGSQLIKLVQQARSGVLSDYFAHQPTITASIHSTMQCMLKGVCAQCLQWQIDPATGQRTKAVFACSWQDQPLDLVDVPNLDERLAQNRLQETLSNLWLDYLLVEGEVERV